MFLSKLSQLQNHFLDYSFLMLVVPKMALKFFCSFRLAMIFFCSACAASTLNSSAAIRFHHVREANPSSFFPLAAAAVSIVGHLLKHPWPYVSRNCLVCPSMKISGQFVDFHVELLLLSRWCV